MRGSIAALGTILVFAIPFGGCSSTEETQRQNGQGGQAGEIGEMSAGNGGEGALGLGRGCDDDGDCPEPLKCKSAAEPNAAYTPPGGLCSRDCTEDSGCAELQEGARCLEMVQGDETTRLCHPSCELGDEQACGGRKELICWPLLQSDETRICSPWCNNDEQCPEGRVCDSFVGLCSEYAEGGGLELGEVCDPKAADPCRAGFCQPLEESGVCTAYCRRGTFPQCDSDDELSLCAWVLPGDEAAGPADVGLCASTCACDSDCTAGLHCEAHPDREGLDRPGLCVVGSEAGIADCP